MVAIAEIPSAGGASEKDCGSCNPNGHCGNGLEKVYPTCAITYGHMGHIGEFRYAPGMLFGCGQKVVIQSDRGTEIGQQKSLTCSGCSKSIDRTQIMDYVKAAGPDFMRLHVGRILRAATEQDLAENDKQQRLAGEMLAECKSIVRTRDLPMKMVACEYLLGGERAIFYFMSESRIDFRDLVHDLARLYHTRIEMRQVGARDEARLVADYEICGRECCCKNFLKTLRPVTMQMAKVQKATLDPSKVSGRCGRLRCCLRYEHETYAELEKKLPKVGKRVRTQHGVGIVVDRQVLTQLLLVAHEDDRRLTVPIEEILEIGVAPTPPRDPSAAPDGPPRRGRDRPPHRGPRHGPPTGRPLREMEMPAGDPERAGDSADLDSPPDAPRDAAGPAQPATDGPTPPREAGPPGLPRREGPPPQRGRNDRERNDRGPSGRPRFDRNRRRRRRGPGPDRPDGSGGPPRGDSGPPPGDAGP